jgi:hypothetical protein
MLLTSGGIAMAHMATPAVPPAMITWPMLRSAEDALAGVSAFFVTSYAAKYLFGGLDGWNDGQGEQVRHTYAALPGPSRAIVASVPL